MTFRAFALSFRRLAGFLAGAGAFFGLSPMLDSAVRAY